jgi:hypothetical protein
MPTDLPASEHPFQIDASERFAGVCLLLALALLSACHRVHSPSLTTEYSLQERTGLTLLVPPGLNAAAGRTQTSELLLGTFPSDFSPEEVVTRCSIHGPLFDLAPLPAKKSWMLQFPSADGWSAPSTYESAGTEWPSFLRQVAEGSSIGCFGKQAALGKIQSRLAEAMVFPADEALIFYYSLSSYGLVDLHPGMQIQIESANLSAGTATRSDKALLAVQDRSPGGVSLALQGSRKQLRGEAGAIGANVLEKFQESPFLLLILAQESPATDQKRHAMLIGAKTRDASEELAGKIMSDGEPECAQGSAATTCLIFSGVTVSLLSTITVNGHPSLYAPGTTLSQVVGSLNAPMFEKAMETVTVQRPYFGAYATIRFDHTQSGMRKLILINGDRISWK